MANFFPSGLVNDPKRGLFALCLGQVVLWTASATLSYDCPPYDIVENQLWGAEWVFATYKHPNVPGLLLEISRRLTGAIGWPAYLLSQLAVATTFVFVFVLGREPLGERGALAGALLLPFNYYFGWHTPEFNHDILLMPIWAGVVLSLWRAVETGKTIWWIALGAAAALSLYAKLAAAVLLVVAAIWILSDRKARGELKTFGPWIALAVFLTTITPLAAWLLRSEFGAIGYAVNRGHEHGKGPIAFLALQSAIAAPAFFIMRMLQRRPPAGDGETAVPVGIFHTRFARFLFAMTVGPLVLSTGLAVANHTGNRLMWGVPMLSLTGLLAVAIFSPRLEAVTLKRVLQAAAAMLIVLPAVHAATIYFSPMLSKSLHRENWPHAQIAKLLRKAYTDDAGRPPTIVAGEIGNWLSGLVANSGSEMISVYTNADPKLSPWITPQRLAREGALVVWEEKGSGPPDRLAALAGTLERHTMSVPVPRAGRARPAIVIGYAVLRPQP